VEATSIKFKTAYSFYPLLDKGKARVKGKASGPNNYTITGEGRQSTLTSSTRHRNELNLDLLTNCLGIMGVEFT